MSAVGTALLQSPGWNEGKARYETLGKHGIQRLRAPLGAALLHEYLIFTLGCAAPKGAQ